MHKVTFEWKDDAGGGKKKQMLLHDTEFIRRFEQHDLVPPAHLAEYCHTALTKNTLWKIKQSWPWEMHQPNGKNDEPAATPATGKSTLTAKADGEVC